MRPRFDPVDGDDPSCRFWAPLLRDYLAFGQVAPQLSEAHRAFGLRRLWIVRDDSSGPGRVMILFSLTDGTAARLLFGQDGRLASAEVAATASAQREPGSGLLQTAF